MIRGGRREDGQGRHAHLEGVGRAEAGLRRGVEVDAQPLEPRGAGEARVGPRRGRLEEGELADVAAGRVEELVRPGAAEGGHLRGGEEALQAVVEVWRAMAGCQFGKASCSSCSSFCRLPFSSSILSLPLFGFFMLMRI